MRALIPVRKYGEDGSEIYAVRQGCGIAGSLLHSAGDAKVPFTTVSTIHKHIPTRTGPINRKASSVRIARKLPGASDFKELFDLLSLAEQHDLRVATIERFPTEASGSASRRCRYLRGRKA
jgi:hypothetical protein